MEKKSPWLLILFFVVITAAATTVGYVLTAWYLKLPLLPPPVENLLPASVKKVLLPSPASTPVPGPPQKPTSVQKLSFPDGIILYTLSGRFPTKLFYQNEILRGEFIIDEDPTNQRIPVIMTSRQGKINIGRSPGSLAGDTTWKLEETEVLRQLVKPGGVAQLRIQIFPDRQTDYDRQARRTLEALMSGNWTLPENFILAPTMVGVVE